MPGSDMTKPRVLLIADKLGGGGSEKQLVHLLRGLQNRVEAHCHVLNPGGVWEDEVRRLAVTVSHARHHSPLARAFELLRHVRRVRPDILHSWHSYACVYPLLLKRLHRRSVIANLRGDVTVHSETGRPQFREFYRLLRFADVVVSNSHHALHALQAHRVRFRRACVIRNGVEPGPRKEEREAEGPVRIVGMGRLSEGKNWAQLIRVCGGLIQGGAQISLSILGEGVQRPSLERLCGELGMDPREVLPGYTTHPAACLARADIVVHCALSEGSPNAVLEALSAGLPVVVPDLEACRELAQAGDFVQLFPVGDDEACARLVESLLRDPEQRRALSERARRFIEREYSCPAMVERYVGLYHEVAAHRVAAAPPSPAARRGVG